MGSTLVIGAWHIALLVLALIYASPFIAGALGCAYAVGREIRYGWLAVVVGGLSAVLILWLSISIALIVLRGIDISWTYLAIWLGLLSAPVFSLGSLAAWLGSRSNPPAKVLTT